MVQLTAVSGAQPGEPRNSSQGTFIYPSLD